MRIKASFGRLLAIGLLTVTGESKQLHVSTQARAQYPRDLVAIHVRQTNINKRDVGLDALDEVDPSVTTTCRLDVLTKQLQGDDQGFSTIDIVLDERDGVALLTLPNGTAPQAQSGTDSGTDAVDVQLAEQPRKPNCEKNGWRAWRDSNPRPSA